MSFNLGQFRKIDSIDYTSRISYSLENLITMASYSTAVSFLDKQLVLENSLQYGENYYCNFSIARQPDADQIITIYLVNSTSTIDTQELRSFTIERGPITDIINFDLIFSPINSSFDRIYIKLQRNAQDYQYLQDNGIYYGRELLININNLARIFNLLPYLGLDVLNKIGVQSAPGLLMCINGEEIRVGRSGIYELILDIAVDFIGFIINEDNPQYFILDYQY